MECTCIRHTDLPHPSKLFTDLVYHPDRVRSFYPHSPYDPGAYAAAAAQADLPPERRAALIAALRPLNGETPALQLLAQPGAVAVVTGQQVGLFSGPAYTIYKALTAVKLARDLTARGIPAVPIFWLATEDHDFAEINHCWIFDAGHRPVKLEIEGPAVPNLPVGQVRIAGAPIEQLRQTLGNLPFSEEVAARVAAAYEPGKTLGEAFGALLRDLLRKFDILQIDPMSPAVRALAAPAIRKALKLAPELKRAVLARNRELADAGYHAQVHVDDQTSFFFLLDDGRRLALRKQDRDYVVPGRRFSPEELMDRADCISPNALLRPVVQDSILPTAAYVGGPAELAYLGQAEVIYREILGRMPVALHRAAFTVIDSRACKLMDRYGIAIADVFHGEDLLRERVARKLIPPALSSTLEQTHGTAASAIDGLAAALEAFDPTLVKAVEKSRKKIEYQLSRMQRKVGHEILTRDARAGRDSSFLSNLIYPHKHLQERLYSIVPLLAKHGFGLTDQLYENVILDCPDHRLLVA